MRETDYTTTSNRAEHSPTGRVLDWKRKSIIDAYVDPTILADNSTEVVPFKNPDGSNADKFVPATAVGAYARSVGGVSPDRDRELGRALGGRQEQFAVTTRQPDSLAVAVRDVLTDLREAPHPDRRGIHACELHAPVTTNPRFPDDRPREAVRS